MRTTSSVTIIIVGYDSEPWIEKCLTSLSESITGPTHVCFVDNHNNPLLKTVEQRDLVIQIVETPRPMGFSDGNNFGLEMMSSNSPFVCFLNQDVVVERGWLEKIMAVFKSNPEIGALSPAHLRYDFRRLNPNFRSSIRHDRRVMSRRVNDQCWFEQDNLIAAAMIVRTSILAEVGGFDPIFGSYCEDYDLCRRIREAGYKTGVVPASRIGHFDGSATRTKQAELKRERQVIRNWAVHRIRSSNSRLQATAIEVCWGIPKRLVKSLLRRPDSQHFLSSIQAWFSLLLLVPRMLSKKYDDRITNRFFGKMKKNLKHRICADEVEGRCPST